MTEGEAKEKWCPFARSQMLGLVVNRDGFGSPYDISLCIGSACMAWRRREPPGPQPPDAPEPSDEGWCGLAGKP